MYFEKVPEQERHVKKKNAVAFFQPYLTCYYTRTLYPRK